MLLGDLDDSVGSGCREGPEALLECPPASASLTPLGDARGVHTARVDVPGIGLRDVGRAVVMGLVERTDLEDELTPPVSPRLFLGTVSLVEVSREPCVQLLRPVGVVPRGCRDGGTLREGSQTRLGDPS